MIEKITAGLDWVSCTLGKNELDYQVWKGDALYALQKVCDEGYTLTPRKLLGFEGYAAGNCFVGENETTGYAQFTGEKADWAYDYLIHEKAHYSRIDVQVTVKYDKVLSGEGKRCYRAAMDHNQGIPENRRRKIWIIVGSDGGDTCYIGSPTSDSRARIYNKEVQSEAVEYTRCWRYEVVLRDRLSTGIARTHINTAASRTDICVSIVTEYLAKRGVSVPHVVRWGAVVFPPERTRPTDHERTLTWLREQVRPAIRRLREANLYAQAIDALGLEWTEET